MMQNVTHFNKTDFAAFVLRQLNEQVPFFQFEQSAMNPFEIHVQSDKTEGLGKMYLYNMWEDYSRTGDLNAIVDNLNAQFKTLHFMKDLEEKKNKGVDLTKIYPVIRPQHFMEQQDGGGDYLYDHAVPRLDSLFIENHDGHLLYLNKQYIEPATVYKNEEEIKQHAYDNLRKKGWKPYAFEMPSPFPYQNAFMQIFEKTDYPFQHQFFLQDMVANHLPPTYLLAIPARDLAVVLITERPITSLTVAKKAALNSGFRAYINFCFDKEIRPISTNIYWAQNGRHFCLPV